MRWGSVFRQGPFPQCILSGEVYMAWRWRCQGKKDFLFDCNLQIFIYLIIINIFSDNSFYFFFQIYNEVYNFLWVIYVSFNSCYCLTVWWRLCSVNHNGPLRSNNLLWNVQLPINLAPMRSGMSSFISNGANH